MSLTDYWQVLLLAGWNVNATARSHGTCVKGNTNSLIVVLPVRTNPRGRESTSALEGQGGSIQEVVNVQVGKLQPQGLTNTLSLAVWDGSVDDSQTIEFMRTGSHDRVNTNGTDAVLLRSTSNNNFDGVSTWGQVHTAMAVVFRIISTVRTNFVISLTAVVTTDEWSLKDEITIIIDRKGIARANHVSNTEDRWTNCDKVEALGDAATGRSEFELVPTTIDLKLNWIAVVA